MLARDKPSTVPLQHDPMVKKGEIESKTSRARSEHSRTLITYMCAVLCLRMSYVMVAHSGVALTRTVTASQSVIVYSNVSGRQFN